MKLVINACYGGFSLSSRAAKALAKLNGETLSKDSTENYWYAREVARDDPNLVAVVERLGSEAASGSCAKLKVVKIPNGVDYEITDYDGRETIEEKHRSWS